jgi:hypothetical protein
LLFLLRPNLSEFVLRSKGALDQKGTLACACENTMLARCLDEGERLFSRWRCSDCCDIYSYYQRISKNSSKLKKNALLAPNVIPFPVYVEEEKKSRKER